MPKNWTSPQRAAGHRSAGGPSGHRVVAGPARLPGPRGAEGRHHLAGPSSCDAHPDVFWTPPPRAALLRPRLRPGPVAGTGRGSPAGPRSRPMNARPAGRPGWARRPRPTWCCPTGPTRVAAALPGVKLVVSLRDPVSRAYSQWSHEHAHRARDPVVRRRARGRARAAGRGRPAGLGQRHALPRARLRHAQPLRRAARSGGWPTSSARSCTCYRSEDLYRRSATVDPAPARPRGRRRRRGRAGHAPHRGARSRPASIPDLRDQLIERFAAADARLQALDRPVVLPGSGLGGPPSR